MRRYWLSSPLILIVTNILIFGAMLARSTYVHGPDNVLLTANLNVDQLRAWGGSYGPSTLGGQYWRLASSLFLHVNISHLAWNMLFLLILSAPLDRLIGRAKTLAIYLVTGVAGALTSLCWHPTRTSVGSSGAIDGLAGVLLALLMLAKCDLPRRHTLRVLLWAALTIIFSLIAGLRYEADDNAAHVGGLLAGLIIGVLLALIAQSQAPGRLSRERRLLVSSTAAQVVLLGIVIGLRNDVIELHRGQVALDKNDAASAVVHLQKFVTRNLGDVFGHSELGYAYSKLDREEEAASEYHQVLQIEPDNPVAQYDLARVYTLNHPDQAIPLYRASLPRLQQSSDKYMNFAIALKKTGNLPEAEAAAAKGVALDPKSALSQQILIEIALQRIKAEDAAKKPKSIDQLPRPN
jgi:membrane associated rhomboid family serine protease